MVGKIKSQWDLFKSHRDLLKSRRELYKSHCDFIFYLVIKTSLLREEIIFMNATLLDSFVFCVATCH